MEHDEARADQPQTGALFEILDRDDPGREGALWSAISPQLNMNLVRFQAGHGVAEHVNTEVDVLLIGVRGEGSVFIDRAEVPCRSGTVVLIPRGSRRTITAGSSGFAYVTVHQRRAGLMPRRATSTATQ